jgi:D-alanine-D-alanine ligase
MKVLVLMGGVSPERDVSLDSGKAVCRALESLGHNIVAIDTGAGVLPPEKLAHAAASVRPEPPDVQALVALDKESALKAVTSGSFKNADVVFIALHGGAGEDGTIQALLELSGTPYTGSALLASALAMDKDMSKKIFQREQIPTPEWITVRSRPDEDYSQPERDIMQRFGVPVIVKPSDNGSTVGLTLVKSADQLRDALLAASQVTRKIMVEEYIAGRELTVGVLDDKALPVVEIIPTHEIYDYECKYSHGMSKYVVPAEIDDSLAGRLQELGLRAFNSLGCEGYARVDFRVDAGGNPFCLEVNTLPGMTSTSLVPKAAKAAGMSFEQLVERICRLAIERARKG